MYADKCSHLFWECLTEDTSLGICEHSFFGIAAPSKLLFWVDKVLHGSTSALISNSPFLTFTLVLSGERKSASETEWERDRESEGRRSYREETSKDDSNFLMESPDWWNWWRQGQWDQWLPLGWRDRAVIKGTNWELYWSINCTNEALSHCICLISTVQMSSYEYQPILHF